MDSVRTGLREGDIEKGPMDRLQCGYCGTDLEIEDDSNNIGRIRSCPDCGRQWRELD